MYTQPSVPASGAVAPSPLTASVDGPVPAATAYVPATLSMGFIGKQTLSPTAMGFLAVTSRTVAAMPSEDAHEPDELMSALNQVPYLRTLSVTAPHLIYQPPTVLQLRNAGARNVDLLTKAYSGLPTLYAQVEQGPYATHFLPPHPTTEEARLESLWPPEAIDWDMIVSELHHSGVHRPTEEELAYDEAFWHRVATKRQRERDQAEATRRTQRRTTVQRAMGRVSLSSVGGSTALARGPPSAFESAFNTPLSRQASLTASAHTPVDTGSFGPSPHRRRTLHSPSASVGGAMPPHEKMTITPAQRTAKGLLRRARFNEAAAHKSKNVLALATTTTVAPSHATVVASRETPGFRFPILSLRSLASTTNSACPEHSITSIANSSEFTSLLTPNTARTGLTDGWYSPTAMASGCAEYAPVRRPPHELEHPFTATQLRHTDTMTNVTQAAPPAAAIAGAANGATPTTSAMTTSTDFPPSATVSHACESQPPRTTGISPLLPSGLSPSDQHRPTAQTASASAQPLIPPRNRAGRGKQKPPPSPLHTSSPRTSASPQATCSPFERIACASVSRIPFSVRASVACRSPPSARLNSPESTPTAASTATTSETRPHVRAALTTAPAPRVPRVRLPPLSLPRKTHEPAPPLLTTSPSKGMHERPTPLKSNVSYHSDFSSHRVTSSVYSLKASASTMVLAPEPLPTTTSTDGSSRGTTFRSSRGTVVASRQEPPSDERDRVNMELSPASSTAPNKRTTHRQVTVSGLVRRAPPGAPHKPKRASERRTERRETECASGAAANLVPSSPIATAATTASRDREASSLASRADEHAPVRSSDSSRPEQPRGHKARARPPLTEPTIVSGDAACQPMAAPSAGVEDQAAGRGHPQAAGVDGNRGSFAPDPDVSVTKPATETRVANNVATTSPSGDGDGKDAGAHTAAVFSRAGSVLQQAPTVNDSQNASPPARTIGGPTATAARAPQARTSPSVAEPCAVVSHTSATTKPPTHSTERQRKEKGPSCCTMM